MGTFLSTVGRNVFGLILVLNMIWCAALCKLVSLMTFLSPKTRNGYAVVLVHFAWRISLFFSPWISLNKSADYDANSAKMIAEIRKVQEDHAAGKKSPPIFVLGNHTSFLDTILTASKLSPFVMFHARTYMGGHLFKLPLLSTICRACGHFPVYFSSGTDGKFAVDREKMAETQKLVDKHTGGGGVLCFFPEGQINGDPDTLMPFRYGGMKKAVEFDAKLWSFVTHGNPEVWPKKAQVGGFPGKIQYSLQCIAADGSSKLISDLRAKNSDLGEKADHVILAEHCRDVMQKDYDCLRNANGGTKKRK
jgi:1-acyl-sn-glycerol-3-phosphate acyltransferase